MELQDKLNKMIKNAHEEIENLLHVGPYVRDRQ